jgi:hypothetical protein
MFTPKLDELKLLMEKREENGLEKVVCIAWPLVTTFLTFQLQSYGGVEGLCAQLKSSPTEGLSGGEDDLRERVEVGVCL